MVLDIAQIRSATCGAELVEQRPEGVWFQRMTNEQLEVYRETNPAFYNKGLATAGVCLSFTTDSPVMELDISIVKVMNRAYGTVEVFCNGKPLENINNYSHMELPCAYAELLFSDIRRRVRYELGAGQNHITIHFPRVAGVYLHELTLADGAAFRPVRPQKKVLVFGDSITQGFDCLRPTAHYVHALCQALGAEEFNKGIGGEKHAPALIACPETFEPDVIVVAYGTNDWAHHTPQQLQNNCSEFYRILHEKYPHVPVIAITPIWRSNIFSFAEHVQFSAFQQIEECIVKNTAQYPNITVVRGYDLVPHDKSYFADWGLHPNDEGFAHYSKNLLSALSKLGFLMKD